MSGHPCHTHAPTFRFADREEVFCDRFPLAGTLRTFDSGDASDDEQRWQLRLSWLPFGPELDLVAPTIVLCGDAAASELLEPVRLPLEEPVSRQWRGAIVELSSPAAEEAGASGPAREARCASGAGGRSSLWEENETRIIATFRHAGAGDDAHQTRLGLDAQPGTYLLVTPPGAGQPAPAAAVLALGAGPDGLEVAVIRPGGDGSPFRVTRRTLPPGRRDRGEDLAAGRRRVRSASARRQWRRGLNHTTD